MPAARVCPADSKPKPPPLQYSRESTSSECPSLQESPEEGGEEIEKDKLTPYQKVVKKLQSDEKWQKDITLGKRIGFYRIKEELGTGNFSQVKAATHSLTEERVAVKILDKAKLDQKTQKMLTREIASMESLHHPHVIRLYEVLETLHKIYLVMEHAPGGELFHRISNNGQFTEQAAKPLFAQIAGAVDHMHMHNIVHRDLKAENIFFSEPNIVKIGDFGFSTCIQDIEEPLRTFCGSPPYAAPELFRDDHYVGPAVDIWAMGVLLYFMLTASMPFKAQTVAALKKQIIEGEYLIPESLSTECHFLIKGVLKQDPKSRTTLDQIKKSNWLSGQTFKESLPKDSLQPSDVENGSVITVPSHVTYTKSRLKELGITETMLIESKERGSRSGIVGTYRIVLHKMQSGSTIEQVSIASSVSSQFLRKTNTERKIKSKKNKKSRTCNIL